MNLRRLVLVGAALAPLLLGCSDSETILSVNVNMGSDGLNRRADFWQPIQLQLTGSDGKRLTTEVPMQTRQEDVDQLDANNKVVLNEKGEPLKMPAAAVLPRFFHRVELPGWTGTVEVVAEATGAYRQTVGDEKQPTTFPGHRFISGSEADDLADTDTEKRTISVTLDPAPIEEEGVSAVFLNFMPPGPEPMPAGGSGGGGAGSTTGGSAAGGGGNGGEATAGTGGADATAGGTGGDTAAGGTAADSGGGGAGGTTAGAGGGGTPAS